MELGKILLGPVFTVFQFGMGPSTEWADVSSRKGLLLESTGAEQVRLNPNKEVELVFRNDSPKRVLLRGALESADWAESASLLRAVLGLDVHGNPILWDFATAGNLIVSGISQSGKTTVLRSLLLSLLYARGPNSLATAILTSCPEELEVASVLPHMVMPVSAMTRWNATASWLQEEIGGRHALFMRVGATDQDSFNNYVRNSPSAQKDGLFLVPPVVVFLDEPDTAEIDTGTLNRLLDVGPKTGVFLVIATQNVGLAAELAQLRVGILSLKQLSRQDSLAILGESGAEDLRKCGEFLLAKHMQSASSGVGFVYVMSNPSIPGRVKIGRTDYQPSVRAQQLSGTSVPTAFRVEYEAMVSDSIAGERLAHRKLSRHRTNENREFFDVSIAEAIRVVKAIELEFPVSQSGDGHRVSGVAPADATDETLRRVCEFLKKNGPPVRRLRLGDADLEGEMGDNDGLDDLEDGSDDDLIPQAIDVLKSTRSASTSMLQRRLRIGYNRAARLMELLEQKGIVGPENGAQPREILADLDRI
jgi:DNA segregation ATPase FtsK/SpoIIIE-like protein